jgi:LacI family transcriptional regulator
MELADRMGYKPNFTAINLRKGKSGLIGLIIPEISPYFFPSVIKAIEEEVARQGYQLLILHSNDSLEREIHQAEICSRMGTEGVLVSLTRETSDIEHFQELMYAGTPVVFFDKILHNSLSHNVSIPGDEAAQLAIQHLQSQIRHEGNILALVGDDRLSITKDRVDGIRKLIRTDQLDIRFSPNSESARLSFLDAMDGEHRPAAIFLMSDEIMEGVLRACRQRSWTAANLPPMVVMSDGFLPKVANFPIDYVHTSGYSLGQSAVNLLFDLIKGRQTASSSLHWSRPTLVTQ